MFGFMSLFQMAIGAYLLWCAITGRGAVYDTENVKKGLEEKYRRTIRIFSAIIGGLMLPTGIADFFQPADAPDPVLTTISTVLWALSFIALVVLVVLIVRMGERKKKKGNAAQQSAPRAAFEFDDEEQTPPEKHD